MDFGLLVHKTAFNHFEIQVASHLCDQQHADQLTCNKGILSFMETFIVITSKDPFNRCPVIILYRLSTKDQGNYTIGHEEFRDKVHVPIPAFSH